MTVPDHLLPGAAEGPRWRIAARALEDGPVRPWDPGYWCALLASKRELLHRFAPLVSVDTGEAREACDDVAEAVLAHAPRLRHRDTWSRLETAAMSVPDDLVVVDTASPDGPRIVAAVVCAPNRWDPRDKVGLAMGAVHAPVPGYGAQIGVATDALLTRLSPDRPVWRANWALLADRAPHQSRIWDLDRDCEPRDLWLRVEEQTLTRMPASGAVLFAIRTHQERLGDLASRAPSAVSDLARAVECLPDDVADYKSVARHRERFLSWVGQVV